MIKKNGNSKKKGWKAMDNKQVQVYDTTLREGCQKTGIAFSIEDKLRILERLIHDIHLPMIEVGWPGSNPKDVEFFKQIKEMDMNGTKVYAFSSTRRKNVNVENDENLQALLKTGIKRTCIFGKSWDLHVEAALETTLEENLKMIEDSIKYLCHNGFEVVYDAEHFFDGFKNNKEYALKTIKAAKDAGAAWIVFCDTNGGLLPQ